MKTTVKNTYGIEIEVESSKESEKNVNINLHFNDDFDMSLVGQRRDDGDQVSALGIPGGPYIRVGSTLRSLYELGTILKDDSLYIINNVHKDIDKKQIVIECEKRDSMTSFLYMNQETQNFRNNLKDKIISNKSVDQIVTVILPFYLSKAVTITYNILTRVNTIFKQRNKYFVTSGTSYKLGIITKQI